MIATDRGLNMHFVSVTGPNYVCLNENTKLLTGSKLVHYFHLVDVDALTHLSRMKFPTTINWTSPFPF